MKLKNIIFIWLIAFLTISLGSAFIQFFVADSNGENITLTWQSTDEQNVKEYVILRGPDKDNLISIATIPAKGSNSSYVFYDKSAYKSTGSFYAYGLVIVDVDGTRSEPMYTFVSHDGVSSIKRTWGSIKALFR